MAEGKSIDGVCEYLAKTKPMDLCSHPESHPHKDLYSRECVYQERVAGKTHCLKYYLTNINKEVK